MKTIKYILYLLLLLSNSIKSQNNINIVFNETSLNDAIKVIKDARAFNFGNYSNQNGLNAWFLNLDDAQIDIQPNNTVFLNNVKFSGGVDLKLWSFNYTPTGSITGSISGRFSVKGSMTDGYKLLIIPSVISLNYSGAFQSVVKLIAYISNISYFISLMPEIEMNMGSSLLPDIILKYFKSDIPQITTNNSEVILTFEVLFDDMNIKNKTIKSGEVRHFKASNSIILGHGFSAESGSTFSASITPKNHKNFDLQQESEYNRELINIGDTIVSQKELTLNELKVDEKVFSNGVFGNNYIDYNVNVFPNPFKNTLSITNPKPSILFSVTITDMQGMIVFERKNISKYEALDMDLSFLNQGIYTLQFSSEIINESKKIIKLAP